MKPFIFITLAIGFFYFDVACQDALLFDEIGLNQTIEEYGLTGEGTIIAVLDRGIDYRHPDFLDEEGNTRILYIYDLSDDTGAADVDNKYGKGTIYDRDEINAALHSGVPLDTRDAVGHGTATASIAAGNGNSSHGMVKGIAPQANLIVVKMVSEGAPAHDDQPAESPFNAIDYLDESLDFIRSKSQEFNMPVSIVANFGSIQGPMDGTSAQCRMLDEYIGADKEGLAFISGSSDDGGVANHASGNFKENDFIDLKINKTTEALRLDLWYSFGDLIELEVITASNSYGPYAAVNESNGGYNASESEFQLYHRGRDVDFFGSNNGLNEILIDFSNPPGEIILRFRGISVPNGTFNAILNPSRLFQPPPSEFTTFAESGSTIWDLASAENNICPNSYVLRESWTDFEGSTRTFVGNEVGEGYLWPGSGVGPTRDGRIGIDISVPGNHNFCAYGSDSYFATFDENIIIQDPSAPYGVLGAVSGASPVLAGVVALMFEADPTLDAWEIKTLLRDNAREDLQTGAVPNTSYGYGKLDVHSTITSILETVNNNDIQEASLKLSVSPNPFTDHLYFELNSSSASPASVRIISILGEVFYHADQKYFEKSGSLTVSHLMPGVYFLVLEQDGQVYRQKILKSR